ncbi:Xpo1-domain-containing protein [Xylona heveae TC161]|uniref:Exportin-T n=1 Tax=Xylona heveae (strain CBS 132557 / TC161) TaxID=1328760 RepID=A0A165ILG6_XYLHT|nr:Xpo1-domain-containing protein [Xylona heveae TC161]KZF25065.1 Xpo1-domain-containing protein [Xylona heveae TC161]
MMDAQVENAIEIGFNPAADQNLKRQAFDFLGQLRSESSGWQVCLSLFTRTPRSSEVVRLVSLELVNNAIQIQQLDTQSLAFVKENLLDYLRRIYGGASSPEELDSASIQNKLTQTLTYLFMALYASGWESFFDDLLSLTGLASGSGEGNVAGTGIYLRALHSVHEEIADQLMPRTADEQRRCNELKDLVRARDVSKIAESWPVILSRWLEQNDVIIEMCLRTVGRWVSWIDIALVVREPLLSQLFQIAGRNKVEGVDRVRDVAIDTFTEIVAKKMNPSDKIEMIIFLNLGDIVGKLIASPPLHDLRETPQYDTDLAESVAKLVNNAAFDIVKTLDGEQANELARGKANELLQIFVPYILRFFSDDFDEICSVMIPSLIDLLTFFRKDAKAKGGLDPKYAGMLPPILNAIISKMKYDETASWGTEDDETDEAEFQELRKRLQVLQQAVAAVDEVLYIGVLSNVIGDTFIRYSQSPSQLSWRDLDLALHEMFLFGEPAMRSGGLYHKGQPASLAAERLVQMMAQMVDSDVASFPHPAIQLQYMEICVRYAHFFEYHAASVPRVLENFVRFVHHDHIRVKTRSWYLFHRLVKHLRSQLGDVSQTVVQAIGDLLVIRAELPPEGSGDDKSSNEDDSADAIFSSQLFLFEAVGCISSVASVPVEQRVLHAATVLNPLFADLQTHLEPAKNGDERAGLQIHHDIMAIGTLARGFSDWMPGSTTTTSSAPPEQLSEEFARAAEAILVTLESLKSSLEIRTAARFAFSRLIGVLGARILPQISRWIDGLLLDSSSRDEMTTFLRLLDQIVYGFKGEIYNVLDSLLTPLLQRVFSGLAEPTSGTDDEVQLVELRRAYLNSLLIILNNDLSAVLVSNANQQTFETVITTLEHFTRDVTDFPTAKLAFGVLSRMCTVWGGPDLAIPSFPPADPSTPTVTSPAPTFPGFDHFMMTKFSPLCWSLPTNPAFDPKDPQGRQVLGEIAQLQRTILSKTGTDFLAYLREVELRGLGIEGDPAEEYLRALSTLDLKGFKQFFQAFVQRTGA